jgi:hypothetical protein
MSVLDRLAVVALSHGSRRTRGLADYHIPESNVILGSQQPATDAYHQ